jgi:hypothetical protein
MDYVGADRKVQTAAARDATRVDKQSKGRDVLDQKLVLNDLGVGAVTEIRAYAVRDDSQIWFRSGIPDLPIALRRREPWKDQK